MSGLVLPPKSSATKPPVQVAAQDPPPTPAHKDTHPCPRCSEHFVNSSGLAAHLKERHHDSLGYLCSECAFRCEYGRDLASHKRNNHYKPFVNSDKCWAPNCSYSTNSADALLRHKKHDHHTRTHYPVTTCPECKTYSNSSVLGISMHMLHWHSEVQSCKHCEQIFSEPSGQDAHTEELCQANQTLANYDYTSNASLPAQALPDGWSMADFDPARVYQSVGWEPSWYRPFPASIPDALLFHADPRLFFRGNILRLAESFTPAEIRRRIHEGRPFEFIENNNVIARRIRTALEMRAQKSGLTYKETKAALSQRCEQTISARAKKHKRASGSEEELDDAYQPSSKRACTSQPSSTTAEQSDKLSPTASTPSDGSLKPCPAHDAFLAVQEAEYNALSQAEQDDFFRPNKRPNRKDNKNRAARYATALAGTPIASPIGHSATTAAATATAPRQAAESSLTRALGAPIQALQGSSAANPITITPSSDVIDLIDN